MRDGEKNHMTLLGTGIRSSSIVVVRVVIILVGDVVAVLTERARRRARRRSSRYTGPMSRRAYTMKTSSREEVSRIKMAHCFSRGESHTSHSRSCSSSFSSSTSSSSLFFCSCCRQKITCTSRGTRTNTYTQKKATKEMQQTPHTYRVQQTQS